VTELLSRFARATANLVGHPLAFPLVLVATALWTWLGGSIDARNYAISILTLLLVFLLQHTQNRDTLALHLKIDELLKVTPARSELRDLEDQPSDVIELERRNRQ
jgi:low affinity Fe/Cu permease